MATLFVSVPKDRLLAAIDAMGFPTTQTVQGRELVVDIHLPECMNVVRVYTSLTVGADAVRDAGDDAVRLVVGTYSGMYKKFFPTKAGVTLKRTAPRAETEDRRVMAWIARFSTSLNHVIEIAERHKSLPCPRCLSPMVQRVRSKDKKPFLGCANFPNCKFCCDVPVEG